MNPESIRILFLSAFTIEVSVSASGKVVPAFEETIVAPIESRIVEVYKKAGDPVEVSIDCIELSY